MYMMYREREYYTLLMEKFRGYGLLDVDKDYDNKIQFESRQLLERYFEDKIFFLKCEKECGFNMETVARLNSMNYFLWSNEFCNDNREPEFIRTAVYFTVLCCLVDKTLDFDKSTWQKEEVLKKIEWEYARAYFAGHRTPHDNPFDYLYNKIAGTFYNMKKSNPINYDQIMNDIKGAFASEIYVSTSELHTLNIRNENPDDLIKKSTSFTVAGLRICAFNTNSWVRMSECADYVGKMMWLMDDLCDLFEDIRDKRKNSLLYFNNKLNEGETSIESLIDLAIGNVENNMGMFMTCLRNFEKIVGSEFYRFFFYIMQDWADGVRRRF